MCLKRRWANNANRDVTVDGCVRDHGSTVNACDWCHEAFSSTPPPAPPPMSHTMYSASVLYQLSNNCDRILPFMKFSVAKHNRVTK